MHQFKTLPNFEIIAARKPGDVVNLEIQRDGKQKTVAVRLQDAKARRESKVLTP